MTLVRYMAAGCAVSSAVALLLLHDPAGVEVVLGMLGPLLVASASWVLAERTWRQRPERLTAVLIAAFAGKLVFFGAYVAVMLSVLSLRPLPFVVSFTVHFISLHVVEAFALRRLFASSMHASEHPSR